LRSVRSGCGEDFAGEDFAGAALGGSGAASATGASDLGSGGLESVATDGAAIPSSVLVRCAAGRVLELASLRARAGDDVFVSATGASARGAGGSETGAAAGAGIPSNVRVRPGGGRSVGVTRAFSEDGAAEVAGGGSAFAASSPHSASISSVGGGIE